MHVEHSYLGWFLDEGRHYSSEMVKLKLFPYQKTDVELFPLSSSCFLSLSRACLNQNKSLSPFTLVKVKVLAIQSCPTLGFLGQQYQGGLPLPFSRGYSWPRDQTQVSCVAGRFFITWATREGPYLDRLELNLLSYWPHFEVSFRWHWQACQSASLQ